MDQLNQHFNRLRRSVVERLGITSTIVPALMIMTCLAVLAIFSGISCVPTQTPPNVTPVPIITSTLVISATLTPTPPTPTLTPTLLPPVTLVEPEDDTCIGCGSRVLLQWNWFRVLETAERYQLRVWEVGQTPDLLYLTTTEDQFELPTSDFSLGDYDWAVDVVDPATRKSVSKASRPSCFHIVPPPPVVRSISPASMVRGTGVQVLISGENLTHSIALTIGVRLSVTVVNSNTITATIPTTLEVGEYPVIVQDLRGRGDSSVLFTVEEPTPTPSPTPSPTATPSPTVIPSPTPYWYPPPTLTGNGIVGRNVTFRWDWSGVLAESEWFAVRVGKCPDIPHSQYWGKEREYVYSLCTLGGDSGDYVWEVAVCRGDPTEERCRQLIVSERSVFSFGGWPCED